MVLLVALISCQTPTVVKNVHMGADIVYGRYVIAYYALIESLHARPLYSTRSGFGLQISFQSLRRSSILEVWSYGKQFDYAKSLTERMPCLIPPCAPMHVEQGVISMNDTDFVTAASNGFEFELVGRAGNVVGKIPAQAFRTVLDMKSKLKPTPPIAAALGRADAVPEQVGEDL